MAQLPGGCQPHQHSSPSALSSPDLHMLAELCAKYSINYDIKSLVMTLFFLGIIMSSPSEGKYEQVFPWHYSLPSLPRSFQSPCALQHTVVRCCAILCVCSCGVGKEQSFKWKKICLPFLKPLDTIKENVIFLPPSLRRNKTEGSIKWHHVCRNSRGSLPRVLWTINALWWTTEGV